MKTARPEVSVIAAVADNGVIGRNGQLPWRLSADLRRFKRLTMGHTLLMGRKTYDSIGRPLPGRNSVVISRNAGFQADGVEVVGSWEAGLAAVPKGQHAFAIGGRQIFGLALSVATQLHWTHVHATVEGDIHFPTVDWNWWRLIQETHHAADEQNEFDYSFQVFQRITVAGV